MISLKELLGDNIITDLSIAEQHNLEDLRERVNKVRLAYGKPLMVTSGFRTLQQHLRIYSQKGITDQTKIPMRSNHLVGKAVDFSDPKREFYHWLLAHQDLFADCGLYMEEGTVGWVHLQAIPPKSGRRVFLP